MVHFPGDLGGNVCLLRDRNQGLAQPASDLGTSEVLFLGNLGCPILVGSHRSIDGLDLGKQGMAL